MGSENMAKETSIAELADMVKGRIAGIPDQNVKVSGTCAVDKYISNKVAFVRNEKYG